MDVPQFVYGVAMWFPLAIGTKAAARHFCIRLCGLVFLSLGDFLGPPEKLICNDLSQRPTDVNSLGPTLFCFPHFIFMFGNIY